MPSDIQPFNESRPSPFPLQVDLRPGKTWFVNDDEDLSEISKQGFDSVLNDANVLTQAQLDQAKSIDDKRKTESQKLEANAQAARQMEGIYEGIGSFLPNEILAKMEQSKAKWNFENIKSKNYTYLPDQLKNPFYKVDPKVEADIFNQGFIKSMKNMGLGNTMPHNATLLYGIGTNPFKKDDPNYELFENSPLFRDLHTQSLSPRRVVQNIDPKFWQNTSDMVKAIQDYPFVEDHHNGASGLHNPDGKAALDWDNVSDPFSDRTGKTFDIKANYNTLLSSQVWRTWDNTRKFAFINRAWESKTRFFGVLRSIMGKASELVDSSTPTDGTSSTNPGALKTAEQRINAWWDAKGSKMDEIMMFGFGLLSSATPYAAEMMDWGNWGEDAQNGNKTSGFREEMVNGYLKDASDSFIHTYFKTKTGLTSADLKADSETQAKGIWNRLLTYGYIDGEGRVLSKFDISNPDTPLDLGLSESQTDAIRTTLRERAIGQFSLEVQDKTLVGDKKRHNIQIKGEDGEYRTLSNVIDLINKGDTSYERIQNARLAYDQLFNILTTMNGLKNSDGAGTPQVTKVGDKFEITLAEDGKWEEWQQTGKTGGKWGTVEGQPVTLQFDSMEDVQAFQDSIQSVTSILEPILGMFGPEKKEGQSKALQTLVDNSVETTDNTPILPGTPQYRMSIDTVFSKEFLQSDGAKDLLTKIGQKSTYALAIKMFARGQINNMKVDEHKKELEEYDQREEDYYEQEIQRVQREVRVENERKAEEAAAERRRQDEKKAQEAADAAKANASKPQDE
jgi:hypothetical protein